MDTARTRSRKRIRRADSISENIFEPHREKYLLVGEQLQTAAKPADTDCKIIYWYGEEEEKARRGNIRFIKQYFRGIQTMAVPKMDHAELVMIYPSEFYCLAKEYFTQGTE